MVKSPTGEGISDGFTALDNLERKAQEEASRYGPHRQVRQDSS